MALAMRMPVSAGLSCDRVSHIDKQRPATSKASLVVKQTSALRRGLFAKQFGERHMPQYCPEGMVVMTLGLPCLELRIAVMCQQICVAGYVRPRSVEAAGSGGGGGGGWAGSGGDSDDSDGQGEGAAAWQGLSSSLRCRSHRRSHLFDLGRQVLTQDLWCSLQSSSCTGSLALSAVMIKTVLPSHIQHHQPYHSTGLCPDDSFRCWFYGAQAAAVGRLRRCCWRRASR